MIKKWFKKKFREWSKEAWESGKEIVESDIIIGASTGPTSMRSEPVLNFTIYNAIGGKIVEFRYNDRKSDRTHTQMYIIGKDDDFGEKISKIATLEVMKQ